ncbi:MAG: glutamine synthetase [Nevskiaceae bacterium]|nr:MAG: glutamine synthetase [Nevskiaceae bacterium]
MNDRTQVPEGVHTIEVAVPDSTGVLRGKLIPVSAWPSVAKGGMHMSVVLYSWTCRCDVRDDDPMGMDKGCPDMHVVPVRDLRMVPWRPGFALAICDGRDEQENPIPTSPRWALERVLARAAKMGFEARIGFEIEFYLLDKKTKQILDDGIQAYSLVRAAEYEEVLGEMRNQLIEFGIPIEAANTEYAPGQIEINVRYDEAMRTADNAVLFRNSIREIAARHGYLASFMAKPWFGQSGSGVHLHHSLWRDGVNAFADRRHLSEIGRWYMGGLLRHLPDFALFGSPTPNSFKRRQAYTFCPERATWGHDNRTVALRVIEGNEKSVRVEQRDGSADANPYLIIAAQIAAGLDGIEHHLDPGPSTDGDAYVDTTAPLLPRNVPEAIDRLGQSELAREVFGEALVNVVTGNARYEHAYINNRVSDVERDRYLDAF